MPVYQWADDLGNIVEESYDRDRDKVTPAEAKDHLISALEIFGNQVDCQSRSDVDFVYDITVTSPQDYVQSYVVCVREMTPGGRSELKNEQRIQPKAGQINVLYDEIQEGKKVVLLGVYKRHNEVIFSAWQVKKSNASNLSTGISHQIKIATIADAIKTGFSQQKRTGDFACSFRKEFIFFYLNNAPWIHNKLLKDMNAMVEDEATEDDIVPDAIFNYTTNLSSDFYRNRIVFGAPGTGKSYKLKNDMVKLLTEGSYYERVTFHPDYTYSNFVGTYKPVPTTNEEEKETITYEFVPGPFMRVYSKALKNIKSGNIEPQLLIIEELNRANVAAVFGEVFQLLDRDENFVSEYPIQPSEDVKKYLIDTVGPEFENLVEMKIPDNMFIWATMNNADQGVLPLDTAFKRRWDFEYLDTDSGESEIEGNNVVVGTGSHARRVEWNSLRKAINNRLSELNVNEDKLLGTFFVSKRIVVPEEGNEIDAAVFNSVFKHKVLMYLFEDVVKQNPKSLFENCRNAKRYSYICQDFDELGIEIFGPSVVMDIPTIVDGGQPEETDLESTEGSE